MPVFRPETDGSGFVNELAGHGFDLYGKTEGPGSVFGDLVFHIFVCRGEFACDQTADEGCFIAVFNDLRFSEHYNALDIVRPVSVPLFVLTEDAERDFGIIFYGIDAVPDISSVKVQPSVFLAVIMIDGDPVGITVISQNGQNASGLGFQEIDTFLLR